jgi:phage-related protein
MGKIIQIDKNAEKEISKFPRVVQIKFRALIDILIKKGRLEFPDAKKLPKGLFEMRVKYKNTYRSFYAYLKQDLIIILSAFIKKTQKTPLKELQKAYKRLKQYL